MVKQTQSCNRVNAYYIFLEWISESHLNTLINPKKSLSTSTLSLYYNIEYRTKVHFLQYKILIFFDKRQISTYVFNKNILTQIILSKIIHQGILQTFPKRKYRFDKNNTLHCLRIHNACSSWTVTTIDVIIC